MLKVLHGTTETNNNNNKKILISNQIHDSDIAFRLVRKEQALELH